MANHLLQMEALRMRGRAPKTETEPQPQGWVPGTTEPNESRKRRPGQPGGTPAQEGLNGVP